MIRSAVTPWEESVDAALREELARGDAVLQSLAPVMRHLLTGMEHASLAEEVVARVRGCVGDLARQLLEAVTVAGGVEAPVTETASLDELSEALIAIPGLLSHVHALAIEWQLTERLRVRLALDPVLSELQQALLASNDPTTAALAMHLLAAQARFTQTQRRMQLPLGELPGDLLHGVLLAMRVISRAEPEAVTAEAALRAGYDESRTRIGLIARLVSGMGGGVAALSLPHAGFAIFATALAIAAGQDRDMVVLSCGERQSARLALALRAAGLKRAAIEEQVLTLYPGIPLPTDWDRIGADAAAALLAGPAPPTES